MSGDATLSAASKRWFVIHTYSGFENKVKEAIESRAKIFGMTGKITRVLVPTEKVVEVRNKQKRETEQKFFPGYVLIEMELTDDTWHLVRSTPKVTGFVGSGSKPVARTSADANPGLNGTPSEGTVTLHGVAVVPHSTSVANVPKATLERLRPSTTSPSRLTSVSAEHVRVPPTAAVPPCSAVARK